MKGIVLAGGSGSRLHPLTKVTNKHLLPIFNKPMVYYPIESLVKAGIRDILLVTGGNSAGDFLRLLGNGRAFGLKQIYYAYQEGAGGIAAALSLAERFAYGEKVIVILGDNIIQDNLRPYVKEFMKQESGARLLLKKVSDPHRFGVAEMRRKKIVKIIEKPQEPPSAYAVVGAYMYDASVFDIIKTLKPSSRGELEITDVNNSYLRRGDLHYNILSGYWSDAGTFESLKRANMLVSSHQSRSNLR